MTVWIVSLMVAFSVLSYFDRTLMSIAAPSIMRQYGISETAMGAVFSAFLLSYALLMIPGGRLADRHGPRAVLTWVGAGAGLTTALAALCGRPGLGSIAGVVPALVIARLLLGVATSPIYPSCARMNANWVSFASRARVQGFISAGAGAGGALSPFFFLALARPFGWPGAFVVAGAVTAAAAIVWRLTVSDYPPDSAAKPGERIVWSRLFTNRRLILLAAGYFAVCYYEYIFFYWVYYYFGTVRHMSESDTTWFTTALFIAWTVMTPVGGWASDRAVARWGADKGRAVVPMAALLISGALLIAGVNLSGAAATGFALTLAMGFAAASDGPYWAAAIDVGRADAGAASGLLNSVGNLGGFLSPVLTPAIAAVAGWKAGLYVAAGFVMASTFLWLFAKERNRCAVPASS
jgi:MFS family permease